MFPEEILNRLKKGWDYNMKKYLKQFIHRGLVFGGFGPIVMGIIYLCLSFSIKNFSVTGSETFFAIITTYLLAFIHAGASIFNQIEDWPIMKSLLCHFLTLYFAYILCYLINSWIDFNFIAILIFTAVFIAIYFVIWTIVIISIKNTERRMNHKLN